MPRRLLRIVVALGAAVLAALTIVVPAAAPSSRGPVAVPARGAYVGAYVDLNGPWRSPAGAIHETTRFEEQIGRRLDVDHHFYGWQESFPTALERDDVAQGRIPMVSWKSPALGAVVSGSEDALITARARLVRAFGAPIFIRWGWEMNGPWTEWSGPRSNSPGAHDGPAKYVAAWRRIHDIFTREGATNVSWVWAPNGTSVPGDPWNAISNYYPGDGYVDWIGFSAYNWGTTQSWSRWSSFSSLVQRFYRTYAARKPIMIAETGCALRGGSQADWFRAVGPALDRYPRIKAVIWFEQPPTWTVRAGAPALAAFRSLIASRHFAR
jgi:hypothetical protein